MSHARKVVAIVEDEPAVRRSLERILRARGIEAESFADGEKFLRYLDGSRPDCVIFGLRVSRSGAMGSLLRNAVEVLQIPILVLTGRKPVKPRKRSELAVVRPFPARADPHRPARSPRRHQK